MSLLKPVSSEICKDAGGVLIASSPFFSNLLRKKSEVLMVMVDFFYCVEANVFQEKLDYFLALAAELQLKGLEENQNKKMPMIWIQ